MTSSIQSHSNSQHLTRVVLEWVSGPTSPLERRRLLPSQGDFVIGRSLAADWSIPEDGLLSRNHLKLTPADSGCLLFDFASKNGTNLNDEPVEPEKAVFLVQNDLIQAGRCVFRVHFETADIAIIDASQSLTGEADSASHKIPGQFSEKLPPEFPPANLTCTICNKVYQEPSVAEIPAQGSRESLSPNLCTNCRPGHMTLSTDAEEDLAPLYETIRLLGKGSMGVVYLAKHRETGQHVALKIIDPETATTRTAIERFMREMAVISALKHVNIVECIDQGHDAGHLWFAMEYVSGISLENLAQANRGTYPVNQACRIICQVLKGLEYAHNQSLVHRDIKPENILIGRTSEKRLIAKISDFGLAKNYQSMGASGLTFSGEMRGTIPFMPPEQMIDFKTVKPSGDLYSTAATLYYLIAGTYVFDSDDASDDMIQMLLDHHVVPLSSRRSDVPQELSDLVLKCLARNPDDRFPTASAMRNAMKPFA
jgi:serine/threonine-protein kinase